MKIFFIGVLVLMMACSSPVLILNVSSQKWVGGQVKTGSGVNYEIKMIAPADKNEFIINDICLNNISHPFIISPKSFQKSDTIIIRPRKSDVPCNTNNRIVYSINNKSSILSIDSIQELPKLFYP